MPQGLGVSVLRQPPQSLPDPKGWQGDIQLDKRNAPLFPRMTGKSEISSNLAVQSGGFSQSSYSLEGLKEGTRKEGVPPAFPCSRPPFFGPLGRSLVIRNPSVELLLGGGEIQGHQ